MIDNINETQASILKELLFNNGTNFASLNKLGLTSDHFNFHIKQLLKDEFIVKEDKKYFLTQKGKVLAGTIDTDKLEIEKWGKVSIAITVKKKFNGQDYILMQSRLKEPFFGYYGFINGKVRYGDTAENTAKREIMEETGIKATNLINLCAYHKLRGPSRDKIILDNYFVVYLVKEFEGKLIDTVEGKNEWFTLKEARKLKTFPGFEILFDIIENEKYVPFFEQFTQLDNI